MPDTRSQQPPPTPLPPDYYGYDDSDEISLVDLFMVVLKRKWLIIGIVFFTGLAAVVISLLLTNIYRSDATILPREEDRTGASAISTALGGFGGMVAGQLGLGGAGSLEKIEVVLRSRYLAQRVIVNHDLMPVLFSGTWDERAKKWKTKKWFGLLDRRQPTLQDGIRKILDSFMTVTPDSKKGIIKIAIEHQNPETAQKLVSYFLVQTSETMRELVLQDAKENMKFLNEQLERATDPLLRLKIYDMLAKEIEKDTFARAQKYYGFYVPDPPLVPDPNRKAKPKRALICILSVVVAFFVAVFLAFFLEHINRLKTDDPDRYQQLKDATRLRRRAGSRERSGSC